MSMRNRKHSQVCFVLEPFDRLNQDRQNEINLVYQEIIEPAVDGHRFRILRSSDLRRGEYVTLEHERLATEEALVIANLTHRDPTVFYCLAARLAARPQLPHLLLLNHGDNCRIEQPVLRQNLVLYSVEPDTTEDGSSLSDEAKANSVREKLLFARRDLTTMVENLLTDPKWIDHFHQGAPTTEAVPQAQAAPPPTPPASTNELVDSLVRILVQTACGRNASTALGAQGDITAGVFRSMRAWPNGDGR